MSLKKILLLLLLVGLFSCSANPVYTEGPGARFAPGAFRVGGDLGYSSNGNGTMNGDALHLDGNVGYFVTDRIELGGAVNLEDVNRSGQTDLEAVFFEIYGRAYSNTVGPYRTFAELGWGTGTVEDISSSVNANILTFALGMMQFVSEDVAVELTLEETFFSLDSASTTDGNGLSVNLGVSMFL